MSSEVLRRFHQILRQVDRNEAAIVSVWVLDNGDPSVVFRKVLNLLNFGGFAAVMPATSNSRPIEVFESWPQLLVGVSG